MLGDRVFDSTGIKDGEVVIVIDGDKYEYMSEQDQHSLDKIAVNLWGLARRKLHGHDFPSSLNFVRVENEAGDLLYSDAFTDPPTAER